MMSLIQDRKAVPRKSQRGHLLKTKTVTTPVGVSTWMKEYPQMKSYRQLTAAERRRNQFSPGKRHPYRLWDGSQGACPNIYMGAALKRFIML